MSGGAADDAVLLHSPLFRCRQPFQIRTNGVSGRRSIVRNYLHPTEFGVHKRDGKAF